MGRSQASLPKDLKTAQGPTPDIRKDKAVVPELVSATGLVGYNSHESESEDRSDSGSSSDSSSSSDEDDVPVKPGPTPASKPEKPTCKFFAKTGRCKMGQKCRFLHTVGTLNLLRVSS